MKVKLSEYARRTYSDGSRPHPETLRAMCSRGDIPGAYQDKAKRWWVDLSDKRTAIDDKIKVLTAGDKALQELFVDTA